MKADKLIITVGAVIGIGLFIGGQNPAHALRCNSQLVGEDSLRSDFITNCGLPTLQTYDTIRYDNFQGTSWQVIVHFDASSDRATRIEENIL